MDVQLRVVMLPTVTLSLLVKNQFPLELMENHYLPVLIKKAIHYLLD
jgi:hypothetical protein